MVFAPNIWYNGLPWQQRSCLQLGAAPWAFESPTNAFNKNSAPDELKMRSQGYKTET